MFFWDYILWHANEWVKVMCKTLKGAIETHL